MKVTPASRALVACLPTNASIHEMHDVRADITVFHINGCFVLNVATCWEFRPSKVEEFLAGLTHLPWGVKVDLIGADQLHPRSRDLIRAAGLGFVTADHFADFDTKFGEKILSLHLDGERPS